MILWCAEVVFVMSFVFRFLMLRRKIPKSNVDTFFDRVVLTLMVVILICFLLRDREV